MNNQDMAILMNHSVTFETKCYENDWRILLQKGYLERMIENCNYDFNDKVLYINNVKDLAPVKETADNLVRTSIINRYYVVDEYADLILDSFGIKKDSFKGGYYYSIAELAGIFLCKSDYLLHFSGDTIIENSQYNWIDNAISIMNRTPGILVANPTWNFKYKEAREESFKEDEEWFFSYGFSDQCYLIKAERFRGEIYNEHHLASERYPKHGGESFEKRVDSYMRNKELIRITSKKISYKHKNFPKSEVLKMFKFHAKQ